MHDTRALVEARLERALTQRLKPAAHRIEAPLSLTVWHVDGGQGEPVPPAVALPGGAAAAEGRYVPVRVGDRWGPPWGTSWFRLTGEVPATAAGHSVELVVDLGWENRFAGFQAEGLAYRPDGSVVKGLHPRNHWIPVAAPASGRERVDLYVEAAANPRVAGATPFEANDLGEKATAGDEPLYRVNRADICVFEPEVWELTQDLQALGGLMFELGDGEPRRWQLAEAIERCLDVIDLQDIAGTAAGARAQLKDALSKPANASAHRISAVGHAHIDAAWLWPTRETVRKVARTTANVVSLLDEHPDLVYAMSSAQQYEWLEQHRPEVFARVAEHIKGGRFVPVGGMWVESDTNMPGAEAMVRQFVYGKRYFLDRFGVETREVWLPDSFGYSAALPQLVKLSGSRWFLTQKLSWNKTNVFPHHTFWWEGIDGSRVFTHFPPIDTYGSQLSADELAHAARNFRDKGRANRSLAPFGWGDGGGGPTREMIAQARRTRDLEGSPRVVIETPATFFAAAEAEYPQAPVWSGELYLEIHRGTYTSQAATKQGNRRCEHLLHEAELWSAAAAVAGLAVYPYDELERIWKQVLLNQFHDILPGSSIAWVHREARDVYGRARNDLEMLIAKAQQALAAASADVGEAAADAVEFNAAPYERNGVPAFGATHAPAKARAAVVDLRRRDNGYMLDNGLLRVAVDDRGLLASVFDLGVNREVLAPGTHGNLLQLHQDLPNKWDAWDVDEFYRNTRADLDQADSIEAIGPNEHGVATVRVRRNFGESLVTQDVALAPGARQVDFRVDVDWHEREKFLKVAFPLDIHTDRAAYETQFGHVYRPIHENTPWDSARFEVCAHRFVHVGEPGYGVALVNDSTYGHDVRRDAREGGGATTTARLSLLRAPRYPDPQTDQGRHTMRYALVPGAELADAVREGYAINLPRRTVLGGSDVEPIVRVDNSAVVVSAIKLADDRSGDVVVRLYESNGGRAAATLSAGFGVAAVDETDLLERPLEREALIGVDDRQVALRLRPFQVVTLRLRRGRVP